MKSILLLIFIVPTIAFSQIRISPENYEKLDKSQKELYDLVYQQTVERNSKVNKFLLKNLNNKRYLYENNKVSVIYDIIDNLPIYRSVYNVSSAISTKTDKIQPGGNLNLNLDGTGIRLAVWDGGPIQVSHPEFSDSNGFSRINVKEFQTVDGQSADDDHGTHVGGTIASSGVNPNARGMAINVNLDSYNFNNDNLEMVTALSDPSNPIILSNHSYGISTENVGEWLIGQYTNDSRTVDNIIATNPFYLPVYSAGNNGDFSNIDAMFFNSDKLVGDKTAKNNLVVANCDGQLDPFTGNLSYTINPGSSQGPSDDLRIKPDITADGTNVFSPTTGSTYSIFSGTSMSAPNTTGTLALLQQYYNQLYSEYMLASTLKGLVIHTATDDELNIGPDHIFGWGVLNAEFAANVLTDSNNESSIIDELTLFQGESYTTTFSVDGSEKLIATICWTDVPGTQITGANNTNNSSPRLVNDLDIRLFKDGEEYFPWRLNLDPSIGFSSTKQDNFRDNVEKIEIDLPTPGTYNLVVSHKGSLTSIDPFSPAQQDFSLIVSGGNLTLNTPEFQLETLSFYPNPTYDVVYFEGLTSSYSYELFDILGKSVQRGQLSTDNNQVDLQSLNQGAYLMKIYNGDSFTTKKIIKK